MFLLDIKTFGIFSKLMRYPLQGTGSGGGGAPSADEKVIIREAGVQVGSAARKVNFTSANDFTLAEDVPNDEIEIAILRNSANAIAGLDASGDLAKTEQHPQTMYLDDAQTNSALKTLINQTLAMRNPADTFSYTWVHGAITGNRNITIPALAASDTLMFLAEVQVITGRKTFNIDAEFTEIASPATPAANNVRMYAEDVGGFPHIRLKNDNAFVRDLSRAIQNSRQKKFGYLTPSETTSFAGTGILINVTTVGTVGTQQDVNGSALTFQGAATAGVNAGYKSGAGANPPFTRNRNSYLTTSFQISIVLNTRIFVGFKQTPATDFTGEDPLNALHGFCIGRRNADANFQVMRNDGAGATVLVDTGVVVDTGWHTVELYADDTNARWGWSLDGSAIVWYTTDIPSATQIMGYQVEYETSDAVAKQIRSRDCYAEVDK